MKTLNVTRQTKRAAQPINERRKCRTGSALIMTIVLTVLLAIVGTLFVLTARVEKTATSARSDNEELKLAVDSVIGTISQKLAKDVPQPPDTTGYQPDYYDYPGRWKADGTPDVNPDGSLIDPNDAWLANLEPDEYPVGSGTYKWRHITDLYYKTDAFGKPIDPYSQQAYNVLLTGVPEAICSDYQKNIGTNWANNSSLADADGDGVSDSRWVQVPNLTTGKGKPVYAAVRIVDNSGMLNINTAYKFNPQDLNRHHVDGTSQMQVNLLALSANDATNTNLAGRLFYERFNATGITGSPFEPPNPDYYNYYRDVVWPIQPAGNYTPFDISDELNLRNRYILGSDNLATRIEDLWTYAYNDYNLTVPIDGVNKAVPDWLLRTVLVPVPLSGTLIPKEYDLRHISTIYNTDRVIMGVLNKPDSGLAGSKMWSINSTLDPGWFPLGVQDFYDKVLVPYVLRNVPDVPVGNQNVYLEQFAQIAANIEDYGDNDSAPAVATVTPITPQDNTRTPLTTKVHYGLDRPIIYLSELACYFKRDIDVPETYHRSYAIEVFKWPGREKFSSALGNGWDVIITDGKTGAIKALPGPPMLLDDTKFAKNYGRYCIFVFEDPLATLSDKVNIDNTFENGMTVDPTKDVTITWDAIPSEARYTPPSGDSYDYSYDVYFGADETAVTNATSTNYTGVDKHALNITTESFPILATEMKPSETYFLRIDDVITLKDGSGNTISTQVVEGDVEYFMTGDGTTTPGAEPSVDNSAGVKVLEPGDIVQLRRLAPDGKYLVVDAVQIPAWFAPESEVSQSFHRDDGSTPVNSRNRTRWIQRLWSPDADYSNMTLGGPNNYNTPAVAFNPLQTWLPWRGGSFRNVGDIGYLFKQPAYFEYKDNTLFDPSLGVYPPDGVIGYEAAASHGDPHYWRKEENVRINLADPYMQNIFQYITVFDPAHKFNPATGRYEYDVYPANAGETSIKGRININTAPYYVIAQLPWVSQRNSATAGFVNPDYSLANAIVAYRDKTPVPGSGGIDYTDREGDAGTGLRTWWAGKSIISNLREEPGFASIGELTTVINKDSLSSLPVVAPNNDYSMWYYALDNTDQIGYPDMSSNWRRATGDGVADDFEERNLIFARISDLVTVRSDVFTAYILVRLGTDGPQKRVVAILDRSGVTSGAGQVKILALQQVPDAR